MSDIPAAKTGGLGVALLTAPPVAMLGTTMLLCMRYGLVVLLLRTNDFWYRVLTSLLSSVVRAVFYALALEGDNIYVAVSAIAVLPDANFRGARYVFATTLVMTALCAGDALFLILSKVGDGRSQLVVLHINGHAITLRGLSDFRSPRVASWQWQVWPLQLVGSFLSRSAHLIVWVVLPLDLAARDV